MKKIKKSFIFATCILLAGCGPSEPDPEVVKLFGDHCQSLGYAKGTQEFNDCVIKIGEKK